MARVANAGASGNAPERGNAIHRVAAPFSLSRLRGRVGEGGRGGEAIAGVVQGRDSAFPLPTLPRKRGEGVVAAGGEIEAQR
jgi:hypothetical protein